MSVNLVEQSNVAWMNRQECISVRKPLVSSNIRIRLKFAEKYINFGKEDYGVMNLSSME